MPRKLNSGRCSNAERDCSSVARSVAPVTGGCVAIRSADSAVISAARVRICSRSMARLSVSVISRSDTSRVLVVLCQVMAASRARPSSATSPATLKTRVRPNEGRVPAAVWIATSEAAAGRGSDGRTSGLAMSENWGNEQY